MGTILLTLSIICGQLVKFSMGTHGGLILLDMTVIILCTWGLLRTKLKLLKPPLLVKASFVFILIALISLILTPLTLTPLEYFTSISYTIRFSLYILLGWLIYSDAFPLLKKNARLILVISGTILAVLGLLQLIFLPDLRFLTEFGWDPHYFRAASTFLDPNFLGSFLVLTLILWYQNFAMKKKWYLYIGVIVYLALLITFSRGAYLAFLTSFTILAIFNKSPRQIILTIILFLGLMLGFYTYQRDVAQPRGVDRTQSAQSRQNTWKQGLHLFSKFPILGWGFNTYPFALRYNNLADGEFLKSRGSSTNDSSLLYVASTTGVLGLISYLFFLFALIKSGWKEKILPAALSGLIAQSFFANTLFYPPILLWIILMSSYSDSKTS